jgi:hypothetical protein
MKTLTFSAIVWSMTVLSFADCAQAQQAKKLFFEGDIVRHPVADQAGPFCVLTSQFKRKEAVAWRIRVLESSGSVADDKVLKSVVVELGDGQKIPAHYGSPPSQRCPPNRRILVSALDHPGRLSDRVVGLQGHRDDDGRHHSDLGAFQAGAVAARGDRGRTGNEKIASKGGL